MKLAAYYYVKTVLGADSKFIITEGTISFTLKKKLYKIPYEWIVTIVDLLKSGLIFADKLRRKDYKKERTYKISIM